MKILFVGLNYFPDEVGTPLYSGQLCEALVKMGHEVTAVVGQPYYPDWQYRAGYSGWQGATERGVKILRCPHYVPAQPTGGKRVIHHASFALSAFFPAIAKALTTRPDVVITVAPSLLSLPVARIAAAIVGAKSWVHVQDFEVEAAIATGHFEAQSPVARTAGAIEPRLLRAFDRASSISPQMCAKLIEKRCAPDRVLELRNWAGAFSTGNGQAYREAWGLGDRKVVLYSGSIAVKQGIGIIVDAARALQARDDIRFIICGSGPDRSALDAAARDLPNFEVHDLQPLERVGDLLAMANVHVLPQIAGAADLVLPSKLTNMLASARPIVATAEPGTGLYAEVEGCGINTPPGDLTAFTQAIVQLVDDPALSARYGAEAGRRAAERWSAEAILTRWDVELRRLVAEG